MRSKDKMGRKIQRSCARLRFLICAGKQGHRDLHCKCFSFFPSTLFKGIRTIFCNSAKLIRDKIHPEPLE